MADIRINQLPSESTPTASEVLAIDGASTRKATIQSVVNASAPVATQAKAEAGVDNNDRMTALSTKQSIASEVGVTVASQANGSLASTAVQPSRQVIAGSGLTGGGDLSSDKTINVGAGVGITVNSDDVSLSPTTISRLIPSAGTTSQVLTKNSNSDYDVSWLTVAGATAVSYAPQSLSASQQLQARLNISSALMGHIFGMQIANNSTDPTNDIDIYAGECASTETNPVLMTLSSTLTKRLDASWSLGSGNGGLDTGTIANGTYHIWVIQRSDTGVVDALFSASSSSPTMPSGYDRKRRIASVVRAGGTILGFSQDGDDFLYNASIVDVSDTSPGTSAKTRTLSVPTGISVYAKIRVLSVGTNVNFRSIISSLSQADEAVGNNPNAGGLTAGVPNGQTANSLIVRTNTSGQIRSRGESASGTQIYITTEGYVDSRGRY